MYEYHFIFIFVFCFPLICYFFIQREGKDWGSREGVSVNANQ